jgi:hypothetical protein
MNKTFVTKTKNGCDVYVDTTASHAATHLKDHPELFGYMQEILSGYEAKEEVIRFETNLGRVVGMMDLVETTDVDDVFYAKRPNREKYTRFVRNREPETTRFVTIELRKKFDTEFEVFTAYVGGLTPSLPFGKDDPNEVNREFWAKHALVTGKQEFLPETVTIECPW